MNSAFLGPTHISAFLVLQIGQLREGRYETVSLVFPEVYLLVVRQERLEEETNRNPKRHRFEECSDWQKARMRVLASGVIFLD